MYALCHFFFSLSLLSSVQYAPYQRNPNLESVMIFTTETRSTQEQEWNEKKNGECRWKHWKHTRSFNNNTSTVAHEKRKKKKNQLTFAKDMHDMMCSCAIKIPELPDYLLIVFTRSRSKQQQWYFIQLILSTNFFLFWIEMHASDESNQSFFFSGIQYFLVVRCSLLNYNDSRNRLLTFASRFTVLWLALLLQREKNAI